MMPEKSGYKQDDCPVAQFGCLIDLCLTDIHENIAEWRVTSGGHNPPGITCGLWLQERQKRGVANRGSAWRCSVA